MDDQQRGSDSALGAKLHRLAELYSHGHGSALMDQTLSKLLDYEASQAQTQLQQLAADLAAFEMQYDRSSTEFFTQFQAGQLDDRMDFVEWAALVQMGARLQERLRLLGDESGA